MDSHEHLFITGGVALQRFPELRLDDEEACVRELGEVADAGGRVVVEATPMGLGRAPRSMAEAARRSGVTIVAATGVHRSAFYLHDFWVYGTDAERLAPFLVADLTEGIDALDYRAPWVERTNVRAGIIKVGIDLFRITPAQQTVIEAAGAAHAATGAPLQVHLEAGTFGVEVLERLAAAGVPATSVALVHADRNPDPRYLRELAATGAFLLFTTMGRVKHGPDSLALALISDLAEAGFLDRLLVGGDMARRDMWRSHGGGPGLAWVFSGFLARLRREMGDEVADAIALSNPARHLAWKGPT
ncbi:MAG: phosphotriesterase family protein [Acidimicrobiales bacterium]